MNKSEQIGKLSEALAKAQGQMRAAKRDTENPFFKSRYADLASVWDVCRQPLADNGLAVVQLPRIADKLIAVETLLTHCSGEWISAEVSAASKDLSPQAVGSVITYLRRYALQAMVGIASDDDDGEEAARPKEQARAQRQTSNAAAAAVRAKTQEQKPATPGERKDAALKRAQEMGFTGAALHDFVGQAIGRTIPLDQPLNLKTSDELSKLEAAVELSWAHGKNENRTQG